MELLKLIQLVLVMDPTEQLNEVDEILQSRGQEVNARSFEATKKTVTISAISKSKSPS